LKVKRLIGASCILAALVLPSGHAAFAGQPNQSCQDLIAAGMGATPGHSANAPGSPFDFNSPQSAGNNYAGSGHAAAMSGNPNANSNPKAVSQYDVACSNQKP
jgi:hypothetical protein